MKDAAVFYCPECQGPMDLGLVAIGRFTTWHCYHCQVDPKCPKHYTGTIVLKSGLAGPFARKRDRIDLREDRS